MCLFEARKPITVFLFNTMQELIKVATNANGKQVVSARELHEWLETEDHFTQWAKRMFEYGFSESVDYEAINEYVMHSNGVGGTTKTNYFLTLDCAKEISMIQRTEKGKQARLYFIECEKQLQSTKQLTTLEILEIATKAELARLEAVERALLAEKTVDILTHVNKTYTSTEISKELRFKSANELNKKLHDLGIQYKQNETWILYSKYSNLAYVDIKQEVLDSGRVVYHRRWTQIGREFLIKLFKN